MVGGTAIVLLVIPHNQEPDYEAGIKEINRLFSLPEGVEGRPDFDLDPDLSELTVEHVRIFKEDWEETNLIWRDVGGFDLLPHCEVYLGDPDAMDEEVELDRALNALDHYGILTAMGFLEPENFRPNTTNRR